MGKRPQISHPKSIPGRGHTKQASKPIKRVVKASTRGGKSNYEQDSEESAEELPDIVPLNSSSRGKVDEDDDDDEEEVFDFAGGADEDEEEDENDVIKLYCRIFIVTA